MEVTYDDIKKITITLKEYTQYDISGYSEKSLKRRVERFIAEYKVNPIYIIHKIKNDKDFVRKFINEITVNTTEFFRDPEFWYPLRYEIYPNLDKEKNKINIWHAGCSNGQEVYSNLILLNELNLLYKSLVFATDINDEMIKKAQNGAYRFRLNYEYLNNFDDVINKHPLNYEIDRGIPYHKYFEINHSKDIIKVKDFLRIIPMFRVHDLVNGEQEFLTKFDVVFCRNVLIYFNFELQKKVLRMIRHNMNKGGYLLLGVHESILDPLEVGFEKNSKYSYIAI